MLLSAQRVTACDSRESCWKAFWKKLKASAPSAYLTYFRKKGTMTRERERVCEWVNEWIASQYNPFCRRTGILLNSCYIDDFCNNGDALHRLLCESCSAIAMETRRVLFWHLSRNNPFTSWLINIHWKNYYGRLVSTPLSTLYRNVSPFLKLIRNWIFYNAIRKKIFVLYCVTDMLEWIFLLSL